jgi:hypothetical protein
MVRGSSFVSNYVKMSLLIFSSSLLFSSSESLTYYELLLLLLFWESSFCFTDPFPDLMLPISNYKRLVDTGVGLRDFDLDEDLFRFFLFNSLFYYSWKSWSQFSWRNDLFNWGTCILLFKESSTSSSELILLSIKSSVVKLSLLLLLFCLDLYL